MRACIAVVEATCARVFAFERHQGDSGIHEEMNELRDLVNPARHLRPSELFSDSRPGIGRVGGLQYGLDDHRSAHLDQLDADFARDVMTAIANVARDTQATRVILCAAPPMLGKLRRAEDRLEPLAVEEIPHDLVELLPHQLRERLAAYGVLPEVPARLH